MSLGPYGFAAFRSKRRGASSEFESDDESEEGEVKDETSRRRPTSFLGNTSIKQSTTDATSTSKVIISHANIH